MQLRFSRVCVMLTCLLMLLSACEEYLGYPIGVSISDQSGEVLLIVPLCGVPELAVREVEVFDGRSKSYLWRIESISERGVSRTEYTVGHRPDGFVENVRLESRIDPDVELGAGAVIPQVGIATTGFRPRDLRAGQVYYDGRFMGRKEFDETVECKT